MSLSGFRGVAPRRVDSEPRCSHWARKREFAAQIAVKAVLPNGDHHAVLLVPDGDGTIDTEARIAASQNNAEGCGLLDGDNSSALSAVAPAALTSEMLGHWERLLVENRLSSIASQVQVATLCLQTADDELVTSDAIKSLVCVESTLPDAVFWNITLWPFRIALQT